MAEVLVHSDPRILPPSYYKGIIIRYLLERQTQSIIDLLLRVSGVKEHCSVYINFPDLVDFDCSVSYFIVNQPKLMVPILDDSVREVQSQLLNHPDFLKTHGKGSMKQYCHLRLHHLPPLFSISKPSINDINSISDNSSSASLVQFCGTVVRTSGIRMLEVSKQYQCQNPKCKYIFTVYADAEQGNMLPQPRVCPSRGEDGIKSCHSSSLRELEGSSICVDYQEIKIQDKMDQMALGAIPRTIIVCVDSDLVDIVRPGDDVVIVGTIIRQWKPTIRSARCSIDLAIRAHSIRQLDIQDNQKKLFAESSISVYDNFWKEYENEPFQGRNCIIRSMCPQLYGMYYVKLCMLLSLIGGSIPKQYQQKDYTNDDENEAKQGDEGIENIAVKTRYQSHILLVGDPGCGKSQLLRFAAGISRRSVITTGIGTTGAGLTCSVVKDGPDWEVEAGALVLANNGVCCIDEFGSIKEQDRATIHEAMEQQTLSIAKAGIVVKLNTRATVVACCNPKGSYDPSQDISTNTAIASPLLSRFDIVLILLDIPNKDWDKKVSTFLLQRAVSGVMNSSHTVDPLTKAKDSNIWDMNTLGQYISYVKNKFHPTLSPEARALLMRYYQIQRQSDERSNSRTTVRLLESLVRISEAHAKLMRRKEVILSDAVVAITCISLSQTKTSILENNMTLQSDFPNNGDEFYVLEEKKVFEMLAISKQRFLESVQDSVVGLAAQNEIFSIKPRIVPAVVPTAQSADAGDKVIFSLDDSQDEQIDESSALNNAISIEHQSRKRKRYDDESRDSDESKRTDPIHHIERSDERFKPYDIDKESSLNNSNAVNTNSRQMRYQNAYFDEMAAIIPNASPLDSRHSNSTKTDLRTSADKFDIISNRPKDKVSTTKDPDSYSVDRKRSSNDHNDEYEADSNVDMHISRTYKPKEREVPWISANDTHFQLNANDSTQKCKYSDGFDDKPSNPTVNSNEKKSNGSKPAIASKAPWKSFIKSILDEDDDW